MNTENEVSPEMNSTLQALALSDIEEGMGHNVTRAQGLQEELAQRRASLLQDSMEAQALKGQEELLAEIVEEEMAHWTQVSVLSHYILDRLRKSGFSPMRLRDSPHSWKNSRLFWSKPRRIKNSIVPL